MAIKRSLWGTFFTMLGSAGYYGAYVYIILKAIDGTVSIGELVFLSGSFQQLSNLLDGILTRFTTVSQGAIYLQDFFEFFDIKPKIKPCGKPDCLFRRKLSRDLLLRMWASNTLTRNAGQTGI